MGLRLEVLQFFDEANSSIFARVPENGTADIKLGAQLIVQGNQEAVFYRDGKALDTYGPGRHTLTTANVPILTRLLTIPWEKSPFQAAVYFVGKQTFLDQKWGTKQPITLRDADFGIVRLRSFGKFSFHAVDSKRLIESLVGTQGKFTTDAITDFLKDLIVSRLTDVLGKLNVGMLELAGRYDEVAAGTRAKVAEDFTKYGLELVDFFVNSITPPEEVQKAIDVRSSMGAVGDLNAYMKFQAANSMSKMAERGGDGGTMGMGLGAGFGMMMPGMIRDAMSAGSPAAAPAARPAAPTMASAAALADNPAAGRAASGLDFGDLAGETLDVALLVRSVITAGGYALEESGDTWRVTLPIGSLRKQVVSIGFGQLDDGGHPIVTYSSTCGPFNEKNAAALLRYNTKMIHSAFAVETIAGREMIVLRANQMVDTLDPAAVSRVLPAIAWQADKVEEKLVGRDDN